MVNLARAASMRARDPAGRPSSSSLPAAGPGVISGGQSPLQISRRRKKTAKFEEANRSSADSRCATRVLVPERVRSRDPISGESGDGRAAPVSHRIASSSGSHQDRLRLLRALVGSRDREKKTPWPVLLSASRPWFGGPASRRAAARTVAHSPSAASSRWNMESSPASSGRAQGQGPGRIPEHHHHPQLDVLGGRPPSSTRASRPPATPSSWKALDNGSICAVDRLHLSLRGCSSLGGLLATSRPRRSFIIRSLENGCHSSPADARRRAAPVSQPQQIGEEENGPMRASPSASAISLFDLPRRGAGLLPAVAPPPKATQVEHPASTTEPGSLVSTGPGRLRNPDRRSRRRLRRLLRGTLVAFNDLDEPHHQAG